MSGMMRKGLFNFIIIAKGAYYFANTLVRITDDDVIRKDGGGWRDGRRRVDVNKGSARALSASGRWSGRQCCSLSVAVRFVRRLITCRIVVSIWSNCSLSWV